MVENPDVVHHCVPSKCEDCGAGLEGDDKFPERFQQWELPVLPRAIVTENRIHTLPCACGPITRGTLPEGIDGKAFGPRRTAMVGYLASAYGMSHRNIVERLREAFDPQQIFMPAHCLRPAVRSHDPTRGLAPRSPSR